MAYICLYYIVLLGLHRTLFLLNFFFQYQMWCDTRPQGECNSKLRWQWESGHASISFPFTFKGWKGRSEGMGNASRPKAGWCSWKHTSWKRVWNQSLKLSRCLFLTWALTLAIGRQKRPKLQPFERQTNLLCFIGSSPLARPWKTEKTQPWTSERTLLGQYQISQ